MNFHEALKLVRSGYDAWAAKPHNKRWVAKIDGTPIPNDLLVNIAEVLASRPASEGEGWVLTEAMLEAGAMADVPWEYADTETGQTVCGPFALELSGPNKIERAKEVVGAVFRAMIAAAPALPADLGGG